MSKLPFVFLVSALIFSFAENVRGESLKYYDLVNKAEILISKHEPDQAFPLYSAAFAANPDKPFSKDLYNAFHCAMDIKNYGVAETYLAFLLKRGVKSSFITKRILKYYTGSDSIQIISMFSRHINDTSHQNELNKAIHRLIKDDQETRLYFSKLNDGKYMVDSTYKMDQVNAHKLFTLFSKLGRVPNENDLGHEDNFPFAPISYFIIIFHHSGAYVNKMPSDIFDTMIYKAVLTYDYHPDWFARDFYQVQYSKPDATLKYGKEKITFPLTMAKHPRKNNTIDTSDTAISHAVIEKKRIDANRKKIGLEPMDELWAKEQFMKDEVETNYGKYKLD